MATTEYRPTSVSPPGATLLDVLEERGITQADLAQRLDRSTKNISEVVNGKAPITSDLALALEQTLGIPARFWIAREAIYREWLARESQPEPTESDLDWARTFPYKEMSNLRWVPPTTNIIERCGNLLKFFGVVSPQAYRAIWGGATARFRCSQAFAAKPDLIAAWLRQGENLAEGVATQPYAEASFRSAVHQARAWTNLEPADFVPQLRDSFAARGVVLLFVPELKSMGVSGATRWLTPERALIQITLRFKTNDHLWFTIFHECCHILRHSKREVFLENNDKDDQEHEADAFASEHLIPSAELRRFRLRASFTHSDIKAFADRIGIAPGIVVGRLQHERVIGYNQHHDLKVKYVWRENAD